MRVFFHFVICVSTYAAHAAIAQVSLPAEPPQIARIVPKELEYHPRVAPDQKNGWPNIRQAMQQCRRLEATDAFLLADVLSGDEPWFNSEKQSFLDKHVVSQAPVFELLATAVRLGDVRAPDYSHTSGLHELRWLAEYRSRRLAMEGEWQSAVESLLLFLNLGGTLSRSHCTTIYLDGLRMQANSAMGLARLAMQTSLPAEQTLTAIQQIEMARPNDVLPEIIRADFQRFLLSELSGPNDAQRTVCAIIDQFRPKKTTSLTTGMNAELDKRERLVLSLLENHPRSFDRDASIRLASRYYLEVLQNADLPCANWKTAVAEALRHDVSNWPPEASLHPLDIVSILLGNEQPSLSAESIRETRTNLSAVDNVLGKQLIVNNVPSAVIVGYQRSRCELIAHQTRLAASLFEKRYGELPESLAHLVTTSILERIPSDPYGKLMRYSRKRRILWSVGINGRDDGGIWQPDPHAQLQLLAKLRPPGAAKLPPTEAALPDRKDDWVYPVGNSERKTPSDWGR